MPCARASCHELPKRSHMIIEWIASRTVPCVRTTPAPHSPNQAQPGSPGCLRDLVNQAMVAEPVEVSAAEAGCRSARWAPGASSTCHEGHHEEVRVGHTPEALSGKPSKVGTTGTLHKQDSTAHEKKSVHRIATPANSSTRVVYTRCFQLGLATQHFTPPRNLA